MSIIIDFQQPFKIKQKQTKTKQKFWIFNKKFINKNRIKKQLTKISRSQG